MLRSDNLPSLPAGRWPSQGLSPVSSSPAPQPSFLNKRTHTAPKQDGGMGLVTCVESSRGLSGLDGPRPCAPKPSQQPLGLGPASSREGAKPQGRILGSLVY